MILARVGDTHGTIAEHTDRGESMKLLVQLSPDASSKCGYTVTVSPLGDEPSWQWDYTMHEDNSISLEFVERSYDAESVASKALAATVAR